jgi:hypothetical protein
VQHSPRRTGYAASSASRWEYFPHSKKKKKKGKEKKRRQVVDWMTHGTRFLDLSHAKRVSQLLLLLIGDLCSIDSSNIISLTNVCFQ